MSHHILPHHVETALRSQARYECISEHSCCYCNTLYLDCIHSRLWHGAWLQGKTTKWKLVVAGGSEQRVVGQVAVASSLWMIKGIRCTVTSEGIFRQRKWTHCITSTHWHDVVTLHTSTHSRASLLQSFCMCWVPLLSWFYCKGLDRKLRSLQCFLHSHTSGLSGCASMFRKVLSTGGPVNSNRVDTNYGA